MQVAQQRDIGAFLDVAGSLFTGTITAGGGGDGSAQTGEAVDRVNRGTLNMPHSGKLIVPVNATLASGETLTVTTVVEESDDGSTGWAQFDTASGDTTFNALDSGSAQQDLVASLDVPNLDGAKEYLRASVTLTFSASSTDTAEAMGTFVFGGLDRI